MSIEDAPRRTLTRVDSQERENAASFRSQSLPMCTDPTCSTTSLGWMPASAAGPPGYTEATIPPWKSFGSESFFLSSRVTGAASSPSVPNTHGGGPGGCFGAVDVPDEAQRSDNTASESTPAAASAATTAADVRFGALIGFAEKRCCAG